MGTRDNSLGKPDKLMGERDNSLGKTCHFYSLLWVRLVQKHCTHAMVILITLPYVACLVRLNNGNVDYNCNEHCIFFGNVLL